MSAATSMKEQPIPSAAVSRAHWSIKWTPPSSPRSMSGAKGRKARLLAMGSYTVHAHRSTDRRSDPRGRWHRTTSPLRDFRGSYRSRSPAAACARCLSWVLVTAVAGCKTEKVSARTPRVLEGTTASGPWQTWRTKSALRISRRNSLHVAAHRKMVAASVRAAISSRRHTGSSGTGGARTSGDT